MLKRIIMHWTAGTYEASDYARENYQTTHSAGSLTAPTPSRTSFGNS